MKTIKFMSLLILGALLIGSASPAFAYPAPRYTSWTDKSDRAEADFPATPVRVLKWVRFSNQSANTASLASGDAVVYDTISDDGVTINTTTTSADGAFAGICVVAIPTADSSSPSTIAANDWGKRNWGWIIVDGPAFANITAGGTGASANDSFYTSNDAAKITSLQGASVAVLADIEKKIPNKGGFFLDAPAASATSVGVFVKSN